jgi:hypothetical protein
LRKLAVKFPGRIISGAKSVSIRWRWRRTFWISLMGLEEGEGWEEGAEGVSSEERRAFPR